jgi:predicted enzyme related to lactoylglutathione lyase
MTLPSPTPVARIDTIEIPVGDLQRAMTWYERALGLASSWSDAHHALLESPRANVEDSSPQGVRVLLVATADASRLGFDNTHNGLRHSVVDFRTDELEALHAHLVTLGGRVDDLAPPANDWAPRGFGFSDPEGNRLAAYTYRR